MKRYVQQKFEIDGKFIFFSFMAESLQPFCIWLIARSEFSEGHNHFQLLLVRDAECVAPVITL